MYAREASGRDADAVTDIDAVFLDGTLARRAQACDLARGEVLAEIRTSSPWRIVASGLTVPTDMLSSSASLASWSGSPIAKFSVGVAERVGRGSPLGPYFLHRAEDDVVVGEIGGGLVGLGTAEIGYAVVRSCRGRSTPPTPFERLPNGGETDDEHGGATLRVNRWELVVGPE